MGEVSILVGTWASCPSKDSFETLFSLYALHLGAGGRVVWGGRTHSSRGDARCVGSSPTAAWSRGPPTNAAPR